MLVAREITVWHLLDVVCVAAAESVLLCCGDHTNVDVDVCGGSGVGAAVWPTW